MTYAREHWLDLVQHTLEHVVLCATALTVAVCIAVPLAVWAHGQVHRTMLVTGLASVLFTVPSLALFALLVPVVGLGTLPAVLGLVIYAQLMLVRAALDGLDSVPDDVRDAATGMGLPRRTILARVEVPLAAPVFLAGVRSAAVTTIGIATIGALIDAGGLGSVILQGIQRGNAEMVVTGSLCVALVAIAAERTFSRASSMSAAWSAAR